MIVLTYPGERIRCKSILIFWKYRPAERFLFIIVIILVIFIANGNQKEKQVNTALPKKLIRLCPNNEQFEQLFLFSVMPRYFYNWKGPHALLLSM